MKQVCPIFILPHSQKQGMVQAEGLQGAVQPNSFIYFLDVSSELGAMQLWVQNSFPLNNCCKNLIILFLSCLPQPRPIPKNTLIKALITLVIYSQRQIGSETGMGEYGQHCLVPQWSAGIFCLCAFLVIATILGIFFMSLLSNCSFSARGSQCSGNTKYLLFYVLPLSCFCEISHGGQHHSCVFRDLAFIHLP